VKKDEIGGACSIYGRNAYKILVGNSEGKGPLRRPRHRWEDNIRMDLRDLKRQEISPLAE
jgi:hypothetical protein